MSFDEPADLGRRCVQPYHTYAPSEAPATPHSRVGRHGRAGRLGFNHEAVRRQFSTIPSMPVSADTISAISRSLGGPALPLEWRAELGLQENDGGLVFFLFAASCRLPQRCCKIGGLGIFSLIGVYRLLCCPLVGRFGRPALFHSMSIWCTP